MLAKTIRNLFTPLLLSISCHPLVAKTNQEQVVIIQPLPPQEEPVARNILLEAKGAYFIPDNKRFSKVYKGGGLFGLELSVQAKNHWYGWFSASTFNKQGHSYGTATPTSTSIHLVPLGLGLKYVYPVRHVDFWVGGGLLTEYMHLRQNSIYVVPTVCKWGVGGIAKAGALVHLKKGLFVNFFTDYSFVTIPLYNTFNGSLVSNHIDLSGVSIGASIGWSFGGPSDR